MKNKNTFSIDPDKYLAYRPIYPSELFKYLSSICKDHDLCLDCATGNGQAANSLSNYFNKIIAVDSSKEQIDLAIINPKIDYRVCCAEKISFDRGIFDLVTVAQGLHWLDLSSFYPKILKSLKPNGVFAAWGYANFTIDNEIDSLIQNLIISPIQSYWGDGDLIFKHGYTSVPFPFTEAPHPDFFINKEWDIDELLGYMGTWSAVKVYQHYNHSNILDEAKNYLMSIWGDNKKRSVSMDIKMRVGFNKI